ncbi:MAG: T9SS type A sorting domain-containing protein [Bacteroidales bacterium]|nr:T9SS type A sorting domain-containing protein [Bacteroidales bacterium]
MKKIVLFVFCWWVAQGGRAQYPPPAGELGSTAIHADSSIFIGWATSCQVLRGYININDTTTTANGSNRASYGTPENALGKADNQVVSLGDKGVAILTFYPFEIFDGPGFDFAIFENGFSNSFLELALVEVSSDGEHFYRFPAHSLTQTITQVGPFDTLDARLINNLAGKYRALYGTPFDLSDLTDMPRDEKQHIKYVRIIDVGGSIDSSFGTKDAFGNLINDPFPTPFASCGFDLDALGIIHGFAFLPEINTSTLFYPNPVTDYIFLKINTEKIELFDLTGRIEIVYSQPPSRIDLSKLLPGTYIMQINDQVSTLLIKK